MSEPIRPASLEMIQAEIHALRAQVDQLQPSGRPMYQFPENVARAVVRPEKYTSSLPVLVLQALRRYAEHRGGEAINVIVSEALRSYIPPTHFEVVLEEMYMEQRRHWAETATPEERQV